MIANYVLREIEIAQLTLDRAEALRYLRWFKPEEQLPPEMAAALGEAEAEVLAVAQPRFVYKLLPLGPAQDGALSLPGCRLTLAGQDIACLLQQCQGCILLAVTLGQAVDDLIRRGEIRQLAKALLLDACASAAVENLCEQVQAGLSAQLQEQGAYLTARFSPGYGDLPLTVQPQFCAALDTPRRIGLTVSASGLLLPRKSVTAVIGLSQRQQPTTVAGHKHNCAQCSLLDCPYRKR